MKAHCSRKRRFSSDEEPDSLLGRKERPTTRHCRRVSTRRTGASALYSYEQGWQDSDEPQCKESRFGLFLALEEASSLSSADSSPDSDSGTETEILKDTTDTLSPSDQSDGMSPVRRMVEYEVPSSSDGDANLPGSNVSSVSADMGILALTAAAASSFVDDDLGLWADDSDGSVTTDPEVPRADYWKCVSCNNPNNNPMYRYCQRCFTVRKSFLPPRPCRRKQSRRTMEVKKMRLMKHRQVATTDSMESSDDETMDTPSCNSTGPSQDTLTSNISTWNAVSNQGSVSSVLSSQETAVTHYTVSDYDASEVGSSLSELSSCKNHSDASLVKKMDLCVPELEFHSKRSADSDYGSANSLVGKGYTVATSYSDNLINMNVLAVGCLDPLSDSMLASSASFNCTGVDCVDSPRDSLTSSGLNCVGLEGSPADSGVLCASLDSVDGPRGIPVDSGASCTGADFVDGPRASSSVNYASVDCVDMERSMAATSATCSSLDDFDSPGGNPMCGMVSQAGVDCVDAVGGNPEVTVNRISIDCVIRRDSLVSSIESFNSVSSSMCTKDITIDNKYSPGISQVGSPSLGINNNLIDTVPRTECFSANSILSGFEHEELLNSQLSVAHVDGQRNNQSTGGKCSDGSALSGGMCMICIVKPSNAVFVHMDGKGHQACCYECAIRTWKRLGECPMCRQKASTILRLVYHESSPGDKCVKCHTNPQDGLFVHTMHGHAGYCHQCAKEAWKRTPTCAFCRRHSTRVIKLYA